nr:hypothetical protein [Tanacetum cinerariifolium]
MPGGATTLTKHVVKVRHVIWIGGGCGCSNPGSGCEKRGGGGCSNSGGGCETCGGGEGFNGSGGQLSTVETCGLWVVFVGKEVFEVLPLEVDFDGACAGERDFFLGVVMVFFHVEVHHLMIQ